MTTLTSERVLESERQQRMRHGPQALDTMTHEAALHDQARAKAMLARHGSTTCDITPPHSKHEPHHHAHELALPQRTGLQLHSRPHPSPLALYATRPQKASDYQHARSTPRTGTDGRGPARGPSLPPAPATPAPRPPSRPRAQAATSPATPSPAGEQRKAAMNLSGLLITVRWL